MSLTQAELRDIVYNFIVYGDFLVGVPLGSGNVNDTYQLTFDQGVSGSITFCSGSITMCSASRKM
jgi:hypothetical protein